MGLAEFWIIPVAVLGAIVGSFLNVVIYRLPLGLSTTQPRWSFCPHCHERIRPHHNIPILSWLLLRARCSRCRAPIAETYPIVECLTMLLFVGIWDALFLEGIAPGVAGPAADWPMAIAYIVLFAALLAGSAMDIETYTIDIRVCLLATCVGVACHGLWGLPSQVLPPQSVSPLGLPPTVAKPTLLPPLLSLIVVAAGAAWLLTCLAVACVRRPQATADSQDESDGEKPVDDRIAVDAPDEANQEPSDNGVLQEPGAHRFRPLSVLALCGAILALLAWQLYGRHWGFSTRLDPGLQRGVAVCFLFMLTLILASMVPRQADDTIVGEIEAERSHARSTALREFAWFLPAVLIGLALLLITRHLDWLGLSWRQVLEDHRSSSMWAVHAAAALHAIACAVLAGAVGWSVRILGTLAFNKEAFGTGDIYIMAAIAAVGGFWLLFFAFFLAALSALVGVLATVFHKSSRAIPFGPWLSLGAFMAMWFQNALLDWFRPAGLMLWSVISGRPQYLFGG
ncbi:MAG: prepilin peptidase [Planctomycetota bacterium]